MPATARLTLVPPSDQRDDVAVQLPLPWPVVVKLHGALVCEGKGCVWCSSHWRPDLTQFVTLDSHQFAAIGRLFAEA